MESLVSYYQDVFHSFVGSPFGLEVEMPTTLYLHISRTIPLDDCECVFASASADLVFGMKVALCQREFSICPFVISFFHRAKWSLVATTLLQMAGFPFCF